MGASGWEYRTPYDGSLGRSLEVLQEQVLASGDYIWPWDDVDPDDGDVLPRPTTLAELATAKEAEEFWEEGTHTVLDMHQIADDPVDDPAEGVVRPLTSDEVLQVFGVAEPGPQDLDRVVEPGPGGPLGDLMDDRWTGRCVVASQGGRPVEVYFWGFSGD